MSMHFFRFVHGMHEIGNALNALVSRAEPLSAFSKKNFDF